MIRSLTLLLALLGAGDPRDIRNGRVIPDEGYCDQPYVVIADDGAWICVMTTGAGVEGQPGQHVVSIRSADRGRTWSAPVAIEPADGPEASWAMPLKVSGGRIYVFYTYNKDNLRMVPAGNSPATNQRVDTLGVYAYRFSDDHGRTWSAERFEIPMRPMRLDRENNVGGAFPFFWGVGKPILAGDAAIVGFAKVGKWGAPGTMVRSQGAFLRSDNLASEPDPTKHRWITLPDGDEGLHAPKGPVSDEANAAELPDGSLYATYRTIDGYPCHGYSRDGGHTWTPPAYMIYSPDGRRVKHPRAANFVRRIGDNRYLYWFHNHGGEPVHAGPWNPYEGRNPAWVCGGVVRDGLMHWSEPEVLLYDDDPRVRISYPDFILDGGRLHVSETQKTIARVHEVAPSLIDGLFRNHDGPAAVARKGLLVERSGEPIEPDSTLTMPDLPDLSLRGGFAMDLWVRFRELTAGQVLFDARDGGRGIALTMTDRSTLALTLNDGTHSTTWDSDPGTGPGTLQVGKWQHAAVTVDAGPRIITFVVDGVLNDGGAVREYGWGRLDPDLGDVDGAAEARLASRLFGDLARVRVYGRPLRTAEAVGNARAGR